MRLKDADEMQNNVDPDQTAVSSLRKSDNTRVFSAVYKVSRLSVVLFWKRIFFLQYMYMAVTLIL